MMRRMIRMSGMALLRIACVAALILEGSLGCSDAESGVEPLVPDVSTLYWRLEAEHPAIMLSVHAPYDTVQLRAVPRNVYGEVLPYEGAVRYNKLSSIDSAVVIDANGFATAQHATPASRIEVTLTIGGITHGDTITIMVRDESPVQLLDSITFRPGPSDSSWRWAGLADANLIGPFSNNVFPTWVQAYGNGGKISASRLVVEYSYDNARIIDCLVSLPCNAGETYVRVRTYAYGRDVVDSVLFRRIEPTAKAVIIRQVFPAEGGKSIAFYPQTLQVRAGTTVFFFNRGQNKFDFPGGHNLEFGNIPHITRDGGQDLLWVDSVDVEFDEPSAVEAGDSYGPMRHATAFFAVCCGLFASDFPGDLGGGDIPAFGHAWDGSDELSLFPFDAGWRSRKFTRPGTYHYTSDRFPGAHGTIVVTE